MKYKINDIFNSIQGEGARTGTANIFIRFSGCNLDCWFCDTEYNEYREYTIREILKEIQGYKCKNIILTGGEPTIQNIKPLVYRLKSKGYYIAIETNGTKSLIQYIDKLDWVTISPKEHGISDFFTDIKDSFNELKQVVTKNKDIKYYNFNNNAIYYLQPEGNKKKNIDKCINYIKENPEWRMSLQLHKILKIK